MRKIILFELSIICLLNAGCSDNSEASTPSTSSTMTISDSTMVMSEVNAQELALIHLSCLSRLDLECNDSINEGGGVLFAPYTSFDNKSAQRLSFQEILNLHVRDTLLIWGEFDGSGEPIAMTAQRYFQRFVNDVDYLDSLVEINSGVLPLRGNSSSKLEELFPEGEFVEFYSPPRNPELMGLDWRSLIFVFEQIENQLRLVALVHNEWTI